MEAIEPRLLMATDILSYHGGELTANGVNPQETLLTPGNVTVSTFGKQFSTDVRDTPILTGIPGSVLPGGIDFASPNGQIYAEPLVKTGVNITTGPFQGVHDVVFVATEMDSLFAIDANGGNILWKDSFLYNPNGNSNPLNANIPVGVTAVPGGYGTETNSQDISPWIGIVSTPVIDPSSGYIYLTAKTREVHSGDQTNPHYVYTLHKVRMSDGLDTSVVIGDTTIGYSNPANPTYTYNSGPYVIGTGAGAINVGGQSRVYFNAVREMNRPGLIINNGRLYIEFASHGDNQPYHGWVLTYDPATLAINGALNTTPNSGEGEAGIWQGGGFGSFDTNGYLYLETGNGAFDGSNGTNHTGAITGLDANGFPINGDYGDSFLKIAVDATTSQGNQGTNKNGWGLKVVDYFSPYNNLDLDSADRDLGSGGPIVLPDSAGSQAHPHLLVGSGKEGKIYLIDRDNMGKFGNTDNVVQTIGGAINGSLDTPAFFNGRLYYTSAYGGTGKSWQVSNGMINTVSGVQNTPDQFIFPGSSPMITANGTLNGIAWMLDKGGQLRAYDASNLATEIWNSSQNPARDALGNAVKFAVATPVNGRVYAGTAGFLLSYGPPVPPTAPPNAPLNLTAIGTGAATVQLTWTDNSSNEEGFKIERSSDGQTFTEVGTVGVNQTFFLDSGLSAQSLYYYRVRAFNSFNTISYSGYTNVANGTTTASGLQSPVDLYTFDEGNGSAAGDGIGGNNGVLSGSTPPAWTVGRVGSGAMSFSGTGTYNQTGQSSIDLQNNLAPVLGGTSSLAFWIKTTQVGSNTGWSAPAVTGVEQNNGANDIGWGYIDAGGHIGMFVGDSGSVLSTVAINNGQWHHVAISRDASSGAIKIYIDGVLNKSATTLPGGNKTSVFKSIGRLTDVANDGSSETGGSYFNGQLDDVRIYNQIIDPNEVSGLALSPATPTNLLVTPASGTQLNLTWNDVATTETGYKIERSINGGPWAQIQLLPANSTSYQDVGLLQDTPYSYRIRATNSAGDSGYSNTVNTATPIAPVTPTDATVTLVSASQINLKWTDNSNNETGFKVLRRIGANQFAQVADLPANTTTYVDKSGITPGTSYDYHIQGYNIAGYSDFTGLTITTLAATPTGAKVVAGPGNLTVSWNAAAGADSYNIYRGTTRGGEDPTPIATGITDTNYVDTDITDGQYYYYQISANNVDDAEGAKSFEATNDPTPPTLTFAAPVHYPTGSEAHGVISVDLNGDGKLDLIVANAGASTVSVLLGYGDGTFQSAVSYPTGNTPKSVIAKDFNGDGKLDLATPDQGSGMVSVLLNKGDGTFLPKVDYTGTSGAHELTSADVDGDNDLDIIEAGWGINQVRVLFNDGHGVFSTGTNYTIGNAPHSVVSFDFNGDTKPDIAVADHDSNNVAVLLNNGNGTFANPVYYNVGTQPHSLRGADLNGDGFTDLATANEGSNNVSVLLGTGTGTFANAVNYDTGQQPKGIAIGDMNNDGKLDLLTANVAGNYPSGTNPAGMTISVLLGTGTGTFGTATTYNAGNTPFCIALGDYDGDGDLDVATANWNGNDVTVLLNQIISVPVPNEPPLTNPDSVSAIVNQPVQINVLSNDTDNTGTINPGTVAVVSQPQHGTLDINPTTGLVTYTPASNYTGADQFSYTVKDSFGAVSAPGIVSVNVGAAQPVNLSSLTPTSSSNGWGPFEKDRSNGEQGATDGHTITLNGQTYATGLGVHAPSDITFNLVGGNYTEFDSFIGVDDEVGNNGSVVFLVYVDGVVKYTSPTLTGASTTVAIPAISLVGASTLRLVVTDGGNGNNFDHADWAGAQLLQSTSPPVSPPPASPPPPPPPPGTTTYVSELPYTVTSNGWGPPEKNRSNGEQGATDGKTITLNTQTYTEGIGVHANSDISVALNGLYTQFLSDIGVDDEVGNNGSVVFQVYVDGTLKYTSPTMTGASTTISIPAISVAGANTLRLVVNDSGNGNNFDHADWANARLILGAPVNPPAAPTGLSATFNTSTNKVDLSWTDGSTDETGFRVERRLGASGTWTAVTSTLPAGTQNYTDPTSLAGSSTYYYRVFSFNAGGDSQESNEFPLTTPALPVQVWLSDLTWTTATNGWGPVEKDKSNGETAAGDGHTLAIRSNTYTKGLGVHAASSITYNIGGLYKTFNTDAGVDNETAGKGSVDFQIYLDGATTPIYDSGTVKGTDAVKSVSINVTGVQTLRLVVTNAGDGNDSDHADWAGAQLLG